MPNFESLVIGAKNIKVWLTIDGIPTKVLTAVSANTSADQTIQKIYAIGSKPPIANPDLNEDYTGTLVLQVGEYKEILSALLAIGNEYANFLSIPACVVTIKYEVPQLGISHIESYTGVKFTSDSKSVDASQADSQVTLNFSGLGMTIQTAIL